MAASMQAVVNELQEVPAQTQRLKRQDFTLTNGTANTRSKIAEYQASLPIAIVEDAMRLMFVAEETKTTDGTASNTETFNLSHNLIDTQNTTSLVLYESGNRVQPDSIDYANNAFDYTDDGTANDLHVYYVPRDPCELSIEKHAPKAQSSVSEVLFDGATSILHERNQNKEPPTMDFRQSPLQPVVPRNWTIEVYTEGPVAFDWSESTDDTTAVNAIISIPIRRAEETVENLGRAVKQDIVSRA